MLNFLRNIFMERLGLDGVVEFISNLFGIRMFACSSAKEGSYSFEISGKDLKNMRDVMVLFSPCIGKTKGFKQIFPTPLRLTDNQVVVVRIDIKDAFATMPIRQTEEP